MFITQHPAPKGIPMRSAIAAALLSLFVTTAAVGAEPKTEEQKTLYALGVAVSRSLAPFNLSPADLEMVQAGISDGSLNKTLKVDLQAYGHKIASLQQSRQGAVAEKAKQAGKDFAAKAAAQKGSTKTDSGMIYTPSKEGGGAAPTAADTVKVHYQGTLTDGKVFDSSIERGQPATFALNQVIPCWTEGLQRMKVGGKARLVCPSDIAYGDAGRPPVIPAGATLVFEVELLEIVKPQ
jgi:FKBP-type peptidyl-prolyl cis-trans isomerase FkpA